MWDIIGRARQLFPKAALENTRKFISQNRVSIGAVFGTLLPVAAAIHNGQLANDYQTENNRLNAALSAKQVDVDKRDDVIGAIVAQLTAFQKDLIATRLERDETKNELAAANDTIVGEGNEIANLESALANIIVPQAFTCESIKGNGYTITCAPNDLYARADRIAVARGIANTLFSGYNDLHYSSKGNPADATRLQMTEAAMQSLTAGQFRIHILRKEDTITLENGEKETAILIDGREVYIQPYAFARGDDTDYANFLNNMRDGFVSEPKGGPYIQGDIVGSLVAIFGNADLVQSMIGGGVLAFDAGKRWEPLPRLTYDSTAPAPVVPPAAVSGFIPPAALHK